MLGFPDYSLGVKDGPGKLQALTPFPSVFLYCYEAMVLVKQGSLYKLFSSAVLIILCVIFIFNDKIEGPSNSKGVTVTAAPTTTPPRPPSSLSAETPSATAVPAKIWYKLGPKGLNDETRGWIDTCLKKNPTFQSEFMTDLLGDSYIKKKFALRLARHPHPHPQSRSAPLPTSLRRGRNLERSRCLVRRHADSGLDTRGIQEGRQPRPGMGI
jgi:hypothetical protein